MSRMFKISGKPMRTWNIFTGCRFGCSYCNARKSAETRFKHIPRYRDGFMPTFNEKLLSRRFKPDEFIFVAYMGDIFWALRPWVKQILARIKQFPEVSFLIISKAPEVLWQWKLEIPLNVYLGTTIESNRDYGLSKAPPPVERFRQLAGYPHNHKFLAVEPVMDFDLAEMVNWVKLLQPDIVEVGADNYGNCLPEPGWLKVQALLSQIKDFCPTVVEKPGLERLKGETNDTPGRRI